MFDKIFSVNNNIKCMKLIKALILFLLLFQFTHLKAEVKPTLLRTVSLTDIVKSPSDVRFNPDGTRIFFSDFRSTNHLLQFDVDTPFNISSIDFNSKVELFINGTDGFLKPQGFEFNDDGTKVFVINNAGNFQANLLSAPYDFSNPTRVADDGFNFKTDPDPNISNNRAVKFNLDGTKMFLIDTSSNKRVVEFNLSTPFDTSTVSEGNSFAISGTTTVLQDFSFDDDGTRMYVIESAETPGTRFIYVYKLSSGFDITTATFAGKVQQVFEAVGSDGTNGTPLGMGFSEDGMKLYQVTYHTDTEGNRDRIHEYDLSCPYGIVICENETASVIGAQVEIAKNVIHQNTSIIFKRFDWLRRNENSLDLNSHNIKININNPILASLKNKLQTSFKDDEYFQASIKKSKLPGNKKNWSYWSHGNISFGRVGETPSLKAKDIKTKGIMLGTDKKMTNNKIFGLALRYGNGDVDINSHGNEELGSQSLTLNIYGSLPVNDKSNLNALLGASFLSIDQLISGTITGERNGRQVFTSFSYETEQNFTKYDLVPYGKVEMGVTQFSDYTDYGTAATNSVESHERLTFRTGNASAGFKFDSILYMEDSQISRNGFLEYVADLTPDIDHHYRNHIDNVTIKNSIKRYSTNNIKGNIGLEFLKKNGHTIGINYERFQSLSNSGHTESLLFKFGKKQNETTNFNAVYDPIQNNRAEINYLKEFEKFNLKLNSNYSLFTKIPDYGANIEISSPF